MPLAALGGAAALAARSAATAPALEQSGGTPPSVTWAHDVAPILHANCAPCHHPGGAGPFSLLTYEDARRHARQIAQVTRRRYMPPWLPDRTGPAFADARVLSDPQIATLGAWAAQGTPPGDLAAAPAPPVFPDGWQLGTPDLVLRASSSWTMPAEGPDFYRNFVFAVPICVAAVRVGARDPAGKPARDASRQCARGPRRLGARARRGGPGAGLPGDGPADRVEQVRSREPFPVLQARVASGARAGRHGVAPGSRGTISCSTCTCGPRASRRLVQPTLGLYFTERAPTRFPMLLQLEDDRSLDIAPGRDGLHRSRLPDAAGGRAARRDLSPRALSRAGGRGHGDTAGRHPRPARPHRGLGPRMAGRLPLRGADRAARRHAPRDAVELRQLLREPAEPQYAAGAGPRGQPEHRRDGARVAAGRAGEARGPSRAPGSRHAPPPGEVSGRFLGEREPCGGAPDGGPRRGGDCRVPAGSPSPARRGVGEERVRHGAPGERRVRGGDRRVRGGRAARPFDGRPALQLGQRAARARAARRRAAALRARARRRAERPSRAERRGHGLRHAGTTRGGACSVRTRARIEPGKRRRALQPGARPRADRRPRRVVPPLRGSRAPPAGQHGRGGGARGAVRAAL